MPSIRHVSLVQKLRWHVSGNISPTAFAIGDVDGNGDNEFVIGNLVGELFVFKGNHPEGLPWLTCKGLGTITAVAIGDIRNWGRNSVVVISAEGLCHIFDISGIEDDPHIQVQHGGDGHGSAAGDITGLGRQLTVPATPSLRPVPDHHHHNRYHSHHNGHHHTHHHGHHGQSYAHATPPIPHHSGGLQGNGTPRQNSTHSSFHQHTVLIPSSSSTTPIHTPSIGSNSRRGSEAASGPGNGSAAGSTMAGSARTTSAMLAGLIGTPLPTTTTTSTPVTSTASSSVTATTGIHAPSLIAGSHHGGQHSPQVTNQHTGRSATSSSSTTPLLRPQLVVMPASSPVLNVQSGNLSPSTSTRGATIATTPHSSSLQSQHQQLLPQHHSSTPTPGSSQQQPPLTQQQTQQKGSISFANTSRASSPGVIVGSETPRWRFVNGRRVLEKPNLTLPVPVNINRAQIADIDGDGINELVLARTDRILHSYALHVGKAPTPPAGTQSSGFSHSRKSTMASVSSARPNIAAVTGAGATTTGSHHPTSSLTGSHSEGAHTLNLMKLLSRTSSISTLDSNGLLSPVEERRETTIHYPSIPTTGRAYATVAAVGTGASGGSEAQQQSSGATNKPPQQPATTAAAASSSRLVLVEKKRWALDGQIHCLSVSTDSETGMPLLLIAQPGLNFVMIDHKGNMIKPPNQVIRDSKSLSNLGAPDTPTKTLGSGDVATDIVCATYYEGSNGNGGKPRDIIGLMSMDGVLALHDMKNQTARVHDLDSTHKIFGFSKLNFGRQQQRPHGIHPHHHISQRHQHTRSKGRGKANQEQFHLSESSDSDDDVDSAVYGRSTERLSSLKYSPRHRREYERLKKRAKKQQQEGGAPVDQILEGDESPMTGHGDNGNGDDYDDDDDDDFIDSAEQEEPSLLVRHPSQPALQNDIFVGCSWSGITFFIDQDFNTAQYDFESRVCAFGAGEYAIFPGKNEPCLFYVDFDDNIYVYYNFHIHLEPSIPFDDVVKTDTRLYQATKLQQKALHEHQYHKEDEQMEPKHSMADKDEPENGPKSSDPEGSPSTQHATDQQKRASTLFEPDSTAMTDEDLRGFIHDSLYNANRYEDEYRELKRLLEVEEAKKRAVLARMKAAEREAEERRQVRQHMKMAKEEQALMLEHQARVLAFAQAQAAKELPHQQPQQQQQQQQQQQTQEEVVATEEDHGTGHGDTAKDFEAQATTATTTDSTKVTSGAAAEESGGPTKLTLKRKSTSGSLSSLAMTSPTEILAATKIPSLKRLSSGASGLSSLAPSISSAPSSATTTTATASTTMVMPPEVLGRRRGSLLIRDVLASYEGKKTPPLVLSPTATSPPSSFFAASTTAESRPTSMAMATVTTPILKRQSSSSSTHRAGEDVASHLPPLAPTTAGPAATATATGLGTATTSVMATNASGNSSGGGGGSEAHPTRKHSGSQGGSSGHRRTTGDGGTHAGNGGTGPRYHHSLSSGQQAHGHVLTSLMKRLNIKDLGHAGRLVHPPSVVSANDAAVFGPGASQGSTSHDQDQASAAEPGSMASSHGSASSSLSSASTATIRNSGGSGSIGYGHGRVIAKSTKSYFYHHHHGRPLTPGGHRSHGIAVGHRGGSVGRRMSVRSRLLLAQQQQQQQQSLQRDEAKHPTHHEEAESGLEGGHSSVSGKQDGTSDVFGEAVSPTNAGDRGDVDSESKQPTTRSGGPISVERSRTPDTSRPGSQSNSRRSSQGAVAMSTTATGIGEFSLGDTATRAAAAAAAAMAPSFDVQAAEMVVGQGCINSEGERAESVEGGRGEDSSDSCSGGMHTPSTISPIPSPGRADESDEPDENVSSTPRLATVTDMASVTSEESSPSVERAHEFELAKSLLSPPSRPGSASSGSTATLLASTATATASKAPACTSTSINTATATSAGGSMSMGIIEAGAGTSTMNDPLDGRRSRAE